MIEFRCDSCEKLLRVGDDKAGARAKCPSCGAVLLIPGAVSDAQTNFAALIGGASGSADEAASKSDDAQETKQCPHCCETIKAAAAKCRFCGERLIEEDGELPRKFDIGKIIGYSWQVFIKNPALIICTTFATSILPSLVFGLLPFFAIAFVANAGRRPGPADDLMAIGLFAACLLCGFFFMLTTAVLHAGMLKVHQKLVLDEPTTFSEMFVSVGDFGKYLGLGIVLGGMYVVGLAACFIPGLIVLLMYWPAVFFIHDDDCGVFESLSRARKLTDNNWMNSFLVGLVYAAVSGSGALLFYIGMLVTIPLSYVLFATSFVVMRNEYEDRHGPISSAHS